MQEPKSFWTKEGTKITWNPIELLSAPKAEELQALQTRLKEKEMFEMTMQRERAVRREKAKYRGPCRCSAPLVRDRKKALDMHPGEYLVARYAETTFRNTPRTVLFISTVDENVQETTEEEIPIWGVLLQEEMERIGPLDQIEERLYCRLEREKTTR